MTYIVSGSGIIHDLENLKEQCNTDDIKDKEKVDSIDKLIEGKHIYGWRYCQHCMPDPR